MDSYCSVFCLFHYMGLFAGVDLVAKNNLEIFATAYSYFLFDQICFYHNRKYRFWYM